MNRSIGDYAALARLARAKREQGSVQAELQTVLEYCQAAKARMDIGPLPLTGNRTKIWAHLVDAIDLAEQELRRGDS